MRPGTSVKIEGVAGFRGGMNEGSHSLVGLDQGTAGSMHSTSVQESSTASGEDNGFSEVLHTKAKPERVDELTRIQARSCRISLASFDRSSCVSAAAPLERMPHYKRENKKCTPASTSSRRFATSCASVHRAVKSSSHPRIFDIADGEDPCAFTVHRRLRLHKSFPPPHYWQ